MRSGLRSGTLTKWNDERGFGFIQPSDGGQEIFLHISEVKNSTRRPQENDTIYYHCIVGPEGKTRAFNAFILGARKKAVTPSPSLRDQGKSAASINSVLPIAVIILLTLLPLFGAVHFAWATGNAIPIFLYPVMSLITYLLYADDKSRAKRKAWRIPEKTLHLCELAGGWIGGLIAQRTLRHKNLKKSYQTIFWLIIAIHYTGWLFWLFLGRKLWV